MRDLQGHRQALVPGLQAALGPVRGLRRRPARSAAAPATEPLCSACTRPDPGFWRSCPGCGQPGRLARRPVRPLHHASSGCVTCSPIEHGQIRPDLQALYQALAAAERPATVAAGWTSSSAPAVLRDLKAGNGRSPTATLDELPAGKTVEHLRSVLVATGTLPPRDEQMTRLERWIAQAIAGRPDPGQQQLLHRYAIWHVVRRLRARLGGAARHLQPGRRRPAEHQGRDRPAGLAHRPRPDPRHRPASATWKHGWPASTPPTAPTPGTSSAGPEGTS